MNITKTKPLARTTFLTCLLALIPLSISLGASAQFELDVKELDKGRPAKAEAKTPPPARKGEAKTASPKASSDGESSAPAGQIKYTVKQGDHIFKILIKELGLSNNEAEKIIPDVARLNKIGDIRKLSVGQVLLLPKSGHHSPKRQAIKLPQVKKQAGRKHSVAGNGSRPHMAKEPPTSSTQETARPAAAVEQAAPVPQAPPVKPRVAPAATASALPVKVMTISATTSEELVDSLLRALAIEPQKKRIVEAGTTAGSILSIKVDRYFEENGKRFIINCTPKDQFNYTLLRLLEREGYRVIQAEREDFRKVTGSLLEQLRRPHDYVVHKVAEAGGREMAGYLVGDGTQERQLFLTDAQSN